MAEERYTIDSFNLEEWAKISKLKESTVKRLREEELDNLQTLCDLEPEDIKELGLTIGERKTLKKGIDKLMLANLAGLPESRDKALEQEVKEHEQPMDTTCSTSNPIIDKSLNIEERDPTEESPMLCLISSDEKEEARKSGKNDISTRHLENEQHEDHTAFRNDRKSSAYVDMDHGHASDEPVKPIENSGQDREDMLTDLNLANFYPEKITIEMVLSVVRVSGGEELSQFSPLVFLHDFIMLDFRSRDLSIQKPNLQKSATDSPTNWMFGPLLPKSGEMHPQDIFLLVFKCCDLHLKQIMVQKWFLCRLAIPFVDPMHEHGKLRCTIWALRFITIVYTTLEKRSIERSILKTKMSIIAFCRIGTMDTISKSIIINGLLSNDSHPTFFHRDCPSGMVERRVSNGTIETSWYVPSGKSTDMFDNCLMYLNLRGDCLDYQKQSEILSRISTVIVLFVNFEDLNKEEVLGSIEHFFEKNQIVLIVSYNKQTDPNELQNAIGNFASHVKERGINIQSILYTFTLNRQKKNANMIKKELSEFLKMILSNSSLITLAENIDILKKAGCIFDEDCPKCMQGKQMVSKIISHLTQRDISNKSTILPLQGKHWLEWSDLQKNQNRAIGINKNINEREEQARIFSEMAHVRSAQVEICKNMSPVIDSFIVNIVSALESDTCRQALPFFLSLLKHHLDELSREILPSLSIEYQKRWQEYQKTKAKHGTDQDSKKGPSKKYAEKKKQMDDAEKTLADASFGLEHIFREVGQVYEAVLEHRPKIENDMKDRVDQLPKIFAHFLLSGQPFELMDGDASNIPVTWVKAVFGSLQETLKESRIFIVSVLGIQSSGKSTLLNTMFGLQFAVSAGRCTRGVYIQLVKVGKEYCDLPFDYILVVDTEGLRAPELGQQKHTHDNEIATLIIGLGDVTMINIKGENYAEMKDVIQVAVHAFLRMKIARRNISNKSKCVFIHQNVPAANAAEKMRHGCQKLQESLDEMAMEAAAQENILDIRTFADIIQFDCLRDVMFFPDLWHGDPPMAYPNIGYTEAVRKLKDHIILNLSKMQNTFFTINDISQHIEDLWKGILADDFVFSFRNVIELKAYSCLQDQVRNMTWALDDMVNSWMKESAELSLCSCEDEAAARKKEHELQSKITDFFAEHGEKDEQELERYFQESPYADVIIQWKVNKLTALKEHSLRLRNRVMKDLSDMRIKHELQMSTSKAEFKHRDEIIKKAVELANTLKGKQIKEETIKGTFEKMWKEWQRDLSNLPSDTTSPESIYWEIKDILFALFPDQHTLVKKELGSTNIDNVLTRQALEMSIGVTDISADETHVSIKPKKAFFGFFDKSVNRVECYAKALEIIHVAFRKVESKLQDLQKTDVKFKPTYIQDILNLVRHIQYFYEDERYSMTLKPKLQVKLAVQVFRFIYPVICDMEQRYEEKHGIRSMLDAYKDTTWKLFTNIVAGINDEHIVADLVTDLLQKKIFATVLKRLPVKMFQFGLKEVKDKLEVIFNILDSLAKQDDYSSFDYFLHSPKEYALEWITKFVDKHYFAKDETSVRTLFATLAVAETSSMTDELGDMMKNAMTATACSSVKEWIKHFCSLAGSLIIINDDHLKHVSDKEIMDSQSFLDILLKKLHTVGKNLEDKYCKITANNMLWEGDTVYSQILDKIWGCEETCPFCGEPCQYSDPNHFKDGMNHRCVQHRPEGVIGAYWVPTGRIDVNVCNYSIKQRHRFGCSKKRCKKYPECKSDSSDGIVWHNYHEYKKHCPDWDIPPGDDMASSKYWLWFMRKYNKDIAQRYGKKPAIIPDPWKSINPQDAKDSLRDTY